jgi:repressor LexA
VTAEERDMLLAHADPTARFDEIFRGARIQGPLVCLDLEGDELDEFLRAFEETANSVQNDVAMERLGQAYARIDAGLAGKADPGWHMLRPAISRLDVTPKHGQYLAFIHMYTRLHRRAPAESDIQNFFQTSGPSVHGILKTLQKRHLISCRAGEARSTTVLLAPHEIPELE